MTDPKSSDTPTPPALSPEDWQKHISGTASIKRAGEMEIGLGVYATISTDPRIPKQNDALNPEYGCRPPYLVLYWNTVNDAMAIHNPHALAALCLYQQEFGFSAKDVEWLQALSYIDRGSADPHFGPDRHEWLASLASRIASLLPPEAP